MSRNLQHSAEVDIYLLIGGQRIEVAGCHGNKCLLRNPKSVPPCDAELVISVDGKERHRKVYLRSGISADSKEIELESPLVSA